MSGSVPWVVAEQWAIGKVLSKQLAQSLCSWLQILQHSLPGCRCLRKVMRFGHRYLIQVGGSGFSDMHIHMKEHLPPWHKQWGFCLSAGRCFCSQGSPGRCGLCLGALPWISFVFTFVLMCECWPKPRSTEKKNPALKQTRSAVFFFTVYSWRDFGRAITSWKIQSRPRVPPPHVYNVAGWKPVDSWSFWNELGRLFRLTGVTFIPQEKLRFCIWKWNCIVLKVLLLKQKTLPSNQKRAESPV